MTRIACLRRGRIPLATPLKAEVLEKSKSVAGMTVDYKVVLPEGYDPAKTYPAVLVFGGGPQNMTTVDNILNRNFRAEAEKRGYIVIAPAAPGGKLFFMGGERIFPDFLKMILADYKIRDGKFHIAGPSNGGIASLHVAAAHPEYFVSVTAFPGYMWEPTEAKLEAIKDLCVYYYVGEHDPYRWHDEMEGRGGIPPLQGHARALQRRKGSAAPARNPRQRQCPPPVRGVRGRRRRGAVLSCGQIE